MKKIKHIPQILCVVFLFFCLSVVTAETVEYYPTDLGNIWVLETADGTERVTYTIEAAEERIDGKEIALFKRMVETAGTDETTGEVYFVHSEFNSECSAPYKGNNEQHEGNNLP